MATRKKVTYVLDEDVARAARVHAARTDRRDSDVAEAALRAYLGLDLLNDLWSASAGKPEISLEEVVAEQHAARPSRVRARRT